MTTGPSQPHGSKSFATSERTARLVHCLLGLIAATLIVRQSWLGIQAVPSAQTQPSVLNFFSSPIAVPEITPRSLGQFVAHLLSGNPPSASRPVIWFFAFVVSLEESPPAKKSSAYLLRLTIRAPIGYRCWCCWASSISVRFARKGAAEVP